MKIAELNLSGYKELEIAFSEFLTILKEGVDEKVSFGKFEGNRFESLIYPFDRTIRFYLKTIKSKVDICIKLPTKSNKLTQAEFRIDFYLYTGKGKQTDPSKIDKYAYNLSTSKPIICTQSELDEHIQKIKNFLRTGTI